MASNGRQADGSEGPEFVMRRAGSGTICRDASYRYLRYICPSDGTVLHVRQVCEDERHCPRCVYVWAGREGRRAAWRLKEVARKRRLRRSPRHVVVSFSYLSGGDDPLGAASYDRFFRKAARVLKDMGALGGCLVFHAWRFEGRSPLTAYWNWGPHVHAMYWGRLDLSKRPNGVIVKVIEDSGTRDVQSTLSYVLNHCSVVERKHALRWYGVATYRGTPGVPKPPDEASSPSCPLCGVEMELELLDYTDPQWAEPIEVVGGSFG